MKRIIAVALAFFTIICSLSAQDFSMMNKYRTAKVRVQLKDSKSGEPVQFATVYLCHQGDSIITNFTLSDLDGNALLEDVTQGKYDVYAEIVGYKPFKKAYTLTLGEWEFEKNLGVVEMEASAEFLEAATVTAAGNAVIIKQDTIIYNASAYPTVENGMLADLLKKMPGIKIGSDGSIQVNGETVNRITVGGKTFFQKDPALAVKNLPAKIVDQIQVIDKPKDDAQFSGVGTKDDQEKVMDVKLKDEYQKGWFGNVKLSGGASINGKKEDVAKNEFLFNGNAMASYYNPTDQVVLLASGKNANEPGSWSAEDGFGFEGPGTEGDELSGKRGLETTAQAGVNYNTSRLKGLESTFSSSYNFKMKDVSERSSRTSLQSDADDILTDGSFQGLGTDHSASVSAELKNSDRQKYLFAFRPYLMYTSRNRSTSSAYETKTAGVTDNKTSSSIVSHSDVIGSFFELESGIKNLGKERRSLTLTAEFGFDETFGNSLEKSLTTYGGTEDSYDLSYNNRYKSVNPSAELSYVEPFGEKWSLQARVAGIFNGTRSVRDAFNGADGSVNDYYTSFTRNDEFKIRQRLLMQYAKDKNNLTFGFQLEEGQNVTSARNLGNESTVGKGEWIFNWAPYLDYVKKDEHLTFRCQYRGSSQSPSGRNIIPGLDITDPVELTAGNIYLRPSFRNFASSNLHFSSPKHYSFFDMYLHGYLTTSPIVNASWFDSNGVRYALPVNSTKPSGNVMLYASFNQSFGKKKNFTFSLDGDVDYSHSKTYQADGRLDIVDRNNFNYETFMSTIWGNAAGDRFYSGDSGFRKSNSNTVSWSLYPMLSYKLDNFSATLMGYVTNRITKYSLDKTANLNTWDFNGSAELLYSTKNDWQFSTDIGYTFYKGYTSGFGKPELIWNAGIAKDIKAFTISLKVADILGQQRSLSRTASSGYVQDVHRQVLGRYFLVGLVYNFGRMNASRSSQVERAMWEMAY